MCTVAVSRAVLVPAPKAAALAVLWNVENLAQFEPKVDTIDVSCATRARGMFRGRGRVAGLPWSGEFRYQLTERGFHSEETGVHRSGLKVSGGFRVYARAASTSAVIHYEHYRLPLWAAPLKPVVRWYVRRSMSQELANLSRLIASGAAVQAA